MNKKSPTFRFVAVGALGIVLMVLIVLAVNTFGLRSYYEKQKVRSMKEAYTALNEAALNADRDAAEKTIEEYTESENISIALFDTYTSSTLVSSERDNEPLLERLYDKLFDSETEPLPETVIEETDNYIISRSVRDVELFGYCEDNRTMVLMSSPMQGMQKTAQQSNRFLIVVAALALVIGFVAVIFLTGKVSKSYELEMENERLQHDLEEKERQNEIQREFVANVSHELKTPITLVQGYAEGLLDGMCEDEESRKYYSGVIVDEAGRMNKIVQQLLMLSSIESGTDEPEKSEFDFSGLVKGLAEQMGILAEKKNVEITLDVPDGITAIADEFKIESVITNYMSNAINHVNENGRILIKVFKEANRVHFSIFNTGKTIPEQELEHIWEKFYKVDKAHTRSYGGSGIGLSIVKAVMDAHRMPYGVRNKEDGVEFWLDLEAK